MRLFISAKITVKTVVSPILKISGNHSSTDTMHEALGYMDIKNKNISINMGGLKNENEAFVINVCNPENKGDEVSMTYHGADSHFNGFFSVEKDCQFSTLTSEGFGYMGTFKTLSIKNHITKDGGTLSVKFKTVLSGVVTSIGKISIDVTPALVDLRS